MEHKTQIILVSNAGVLVVHKGVRILIDGLYKDLGGNFTDLPEWAWKLMKEGKGELGNVEYLLFSHSHYDHYYSPYFMEYMKHNKIKGLCLPPIDDTNGLQDSWEKFNDLLLKFDEDNTVTLDEGIQLKMFTTRHVDTQYHHIRNQCFFLDLDGTKVAFLSDADYYEQDFQNDQEFQVDIAFVTPIYYNNPKGRKILTEIMKVKKIIIYHLPSVEDDRFMYFKMAQRDVKKYACADYEVSIWNQTGQLIML